MNENIDLTNILKDCPEGTKLYSTIFGEVEFQKIEEESNYPIACVAIAGNNCDVTADGRYYDVFGGECILFPSRDQRDWSKFTAPWLKKERDTIAWLKEQGEQEEPQVYETEDGKIITYSETDGYKFDEPKFHKGQWIACKGLNTALIIDIVDDKYEVEFFDGNKGFPHIDYVDRLFNLWTIQDARDGDVLANDHHILILKELVYDWSSNGTIYSVKAYCGIKPNGNFEIGKDNWCFCGTLHIHPATKEQRDALMKAMNDAGYKWNAKTKTLEELVKPKFDPKTLKPFDRVLARIDGGNAYCWFADFVSTPTIEKYDLLPCIMSNKDTNMIIPYNDETKHLVGTAEEAPEYYRYWEE